VAATAALWATMWAVALWVQPVSRRACNAAYILWVLAFNLQVCLIPSPARGHYVAALCHAGLWTNHSMSMHRFDALQMLTAYAVANMLNPAAWAGIFHDVNRSMLPVFLVANLLTGGINLSIDTLAVADWAAIGIVALYTVALCGLACAFNVWQGPTRTRSAPAAAAAVPVDH
jgi:glucosaminylphosphatidylinositol acyltransferase